MKKEQGFIFILMIFYMFMFTTYAISQEQQIRRENWTVKTDSKNSTLTIEFNQLGVVLNNVQLHIKQGDKWQKISNWQVTEEDHRILILTENPTTEWTFYIRNRVLGISTTVRDGKVTAVAPADENRFPARMIDYSGGATPVAWKGTNEIGHNFGGNLTKNLSFLPSEN